MSLCRTGYAPVAAGFVGFSLQAHTALGAYVDVLVLVVVLLCLRRVWLQMAGRWKELGRHG